MTINCILPIGWIRSSDVRDIINKSHYSIVCGKNRCLFIYYEVNGVSKIAHVSWRRCFVDTVAILGTGSLYLLIAFFLTIVLCLVVICILLQDILHQWTCRYDCDIGCERKWHYNLKYLPNTTVQFRYGNYSFAHHKSNQNC